MFVLKEVGRTKRRVMTLEFFTPKTSDGDKFVNELRKLLATYGTSRGKVRFALEAAPRPRARKRR